MEDLKGLKVRNPTRLAGEALKALGATSIGMPVTQVAESLAQRVIDGCVLTWEVVPALKVQELLRFRTAIPGSPTLYTATFFLAMNKPRCESLPAKLKAVLDKSSGMAFAARAGTMWDIEAFNVAQMVQQRGNSITTISEDERNRWIEVTKPVHAAWVEQVKAKGLDGAKLVDAAKALIAKHDKA